MTTQDELSALLSRNLTLEPVPAAGRVQLAGQDDKIIYISQHYIPPTYSCPPAAAAASTPAPATNAQAQTAASSSQASEQPEVNYAAIVHHLQYHGVDTSGLSKAQLQLFKSVDEPQRVLLIDLWKACPPTSQADNPTLAWDTTTVDQEITLANIRYEQQAQAQLEAEAMAAQQAPAPADDDSLMSQDGMPLTPVQSNDSHEGWVQMLPTSYMEPYMMSGYEELARREYEESARKAMADAAATAVKDRVVIANATMPTFNPAHSDPVYQHTNTNAASGGGGGCFMTVADWRRRQQQQQESMEDQYGRLMHEHHW